MVASTTSATSRGTLSPVNFSRSAMAQPNPLILTNPMPTHYDRRTFSQESQPTSPSPYHLPLPTVPNLNYYLSQPLHLQTNPNPNGSPSQSLPTSTTPVPTTTTNNHGQRKTTHDMEPSSPTHAPTHHGCPPSQCLACHPESGSTIHGRRVLGSAHCVGGV